MNMTCFGADNSSARYGLAGFVLCRRRYAEGSSIHSCHRNVLKIVAVDVYYLL